MDNNLLLNSFEKMETHSTAAVKCAEEFSKVYFSKEKNHILLDVIMQQMELSCIEMRKACERIRLEYPIDENKKKGRRKKKIYGEVTMLENGWLDIRLNTLLPHCKVVGDTRYIHDTVTRLLDDFQKDGGKIPFFDKAYLAIVEHCNFDVFNAFDNDNKGFKGAINAVKGRVFYDDDQFELSLGLFTVYDLEDICCHIYISHENDAGKLVNYILKKQ